MTEADAFLVLTALSIAVIQDSRARQFWVRTTGLAVGLIAGTMLFG